MLAQTVASHPIDVDTTTIPLATAMRCELPSGARHAPPPPPLLLRVSANDHRGRSRYHHHQEDEHQLRRMNRWSQRWGVCLAGTNAVVLLMSTALCSGSAILLYSAMETMRETGCV